MQMIPSAEAIGQGDCEASRTIGAHVRGLCGFHPCGDTQQRFRLRIRRLENEAREISRKMNDMLPRAACDFEDDARHRQEVAKDIENEIAIVYCRGRVLAVIGHLSRPFNLASAAYATLSSPRFFLIRSETSPARRHSLSQRRDLSGVTTTPMLIV
jgi:hypothetical protein